MNPTASDVRRVLNAAGAIGHGNAVVRDAVVSRLTGRGFTTDVRRLKAIAEETRTAEALRTKPENAILFNERGYYLPYQADRQAMATDFRICSERLDKLSRPNYLASQRLRALAEELAQRVGECGNLFGEHA